MKTFKIKYQFDGYKFYEYVEAETSKQASEYLKWIKKDECAVISTEECNEIATYYCPQGWVKPESLAHAKLRCYQKWVGNYLPNFVRNGNVYECEELAEFLLSEGWTRIENNKVDEDGFKEETIIYKKWDREILAYPSYIS